MAKVFERHETAELATARALELSKRDEYRDRVFYVTESPLVQTEGAPRFVVDENCMILAGDRRIGSYNRGRRVRGSVERV